MKRLLGQVEHFLSDYGGLLAGVSFSLLLGSAVFSVLLVVKLPADYWLESKHPTSFAERPIQMILRNVTSITLFTLGLFMLLLPGPGIMTLVSAFIVADFPYRRRVLLKMVESKTIRQGLNSIRKAFGQKIFKF